MFGRVCDTVHCSGVPVARGRRRFAAHHPKTGAPLRHRADGRPVLVDEDKELCLAPGCLEHFQDLLLAVETLDGSIDPLPGRRPYVVEV